MDYRNEITAYFEKEKHILDAISKDDINDLMNLLVDAQEKGKNIFIMGNGGSAATA
jgi:D-sedoheptulose 7-phosphate isomerase